MVHIVTARPSRVKYEWMGTYNRSGNGRGARVALRSHLTHTHHQFHRNVGVLLRVIGVLLKLKVSRFGDVMVSVLVHLSTNSLKCIHPLS
jgi:hypothetical protein